MKIDFIIISGILVIISFLPFILLPLLGRKDKQKLIKTFRQNALELGFNISYEQQWNTNVAGLDIMNRQFLFLQKPEADYIKSHIDLKQVKEIKLLIQNTEFKLQNKQVETLSRVDLEFHTHTSESPTVVNIFDYELNYTEDLEIKNAQKLLLELQKYIHAKPVLRHTA